MELLNNPIFDKLATLIVFPFIGYIVVQVKRIFNRIQLAEFKHIATIEALQLTFQNGFKDEYDRKMKELIRDNKFKIKGE
jgi:hypothetical protein